MDAFFNSSKNRCLSKNCINALDIAGFVFDSFTFFFSGKLRFMIHCTGNKDSSHNQITQWILDNLAPSIHSAIHHNQTKTLSHFSHLSDTTTTTTGKSKKQKGRFFSTTFRSVYSNWCIDISLHGYAITYSFKSSNCFKTIVHCWLTCSES